MGGSGGGGGGRGDLDHKTPFFIEAELSIKYFVIKPRLEGGNSVLKFLFFVRKRVIFFKKNVFPFPSLMVFLTIHLFSSSIKVISDTSLHKNCYENKPKINIFLKYRRLLYILNGS